MNPIDIQRQTAQAKKLRARIAIDQIDLKRLLLRLTDAGVSQVQLGRALGISQPTLSSNLKTAARINPIVPGFSGADPYEISQRFAAGVLTRDRLLDELLRWEFVPSALVDGQNDLAFDIPGSFDDVVRAYGDGLIDAVLYEHLLDARPRVGQDV